MTVKVDFSINTVELEVNYKSFFLRRQFVCVRQQPNSISTLQPITGRKSETAIPRISAFLAQDDDFPAF